MTTLEDHWEQEEPNVLWVNNPLKRKLESLITSRPHYDITKDILDARAEVTFGQLLATYSDQLARLNSTLNNPKELNNVDEYKTMTEYTPIKVYARIKENAILTIVDTGACMSVITKPLAQALGLKWVPS